MVFTLILWIDWPNDYRGKTIKSSLTICTLAYPSWFIWEGHGILAAGTVCANRKNVPSLFWNPPKMQHGEHKTFQDKNNRFLTATAWKDTGKFLVKFLSTLSQPTVATHCVRRVGSSRQRIPQPLVAHQYNHSYGFIDMFDLYRSKYKVGRNSKKAWK